jgi:hypothetical protein
MDQEGYFEEPYKRIHSEDGVVTRGTAIRLGLGLGFAPLGLVIEGQRGSHYGRCFAKGVASSLWGWILVKPSKNEHTKPVSEERCWRCVA